MKRILLIIPTFCILLAIGGCANPTRFQADYASGLVLNNTFYLVSNQAIPKDSLGEQIGEIKAQVEPMPKKSGEANFLPIGTKLYAVNGEYKSQTIAYELQNEYRKTAINKPAYIREIAYNSLSEEDKKTVIDWTALTGVDILSTI